MFYGTWGLRVRIVSVRRGIKLKPFNREWNFGYLSRNTMKADLLQGKFLYSNHLYVLDDQFEVLKMALDKLSTEIIVIVTKIWVR